jgi:MerR family transcriptional regulator/heat shock protein HspR
MNEERYNNEPRYVISVAARMLEIHTHTLRYYEKVGIIEPYRSRGNIRLYSDRDIAILKKVKSLVEDMGINLPGVEVILRMIQQVYDLQNELEDAQQEIKKLRGGKES